MHASRKIGDEAAGRVDALRWVRRREACVCLGGAALLAWPGRSRADTLALQHGREEFGELALGAARLGLNERIGFLNDWVNQLVEPRADDPAHDDWATPFETLARGAGDCEDSAIAKFFLLRASGAPDDGLRLLYAWYLPHDPRGLRRAHMVTLARWPFDDPWVLD